jgi:nicotinamide-nucleotide amidase
MPPTPAGILSTGTEILQGLYADTNAQWLSERLGEAGLEVVRHVAAPDDARAVADALNYLAGVCRVVVITGGLGPTEDDLTRQAVAEFFGRPLVEDARAWRMIEERWGKRGSPPPRSNRVQCLVPEGARVLYNRWGTAAGFIVERGRGGNGLWFAAMPGPPREMQPMYRAYLEKELAKRFGGGLIARAVTLHTFGVSESFLNGLLRPLFDETREDPYRTLAFLAGEARVDVRVTCSGRTRAELRRRLDPLVARARRRAPRGCMYGRDADTLESVVGRLLRRQGLKLAVAESCTGGLVAKRLTDVPGSSEFLIEGLVAYSDEAKRARLGVSAATLRRHGAVSAEVAQEMALGALRHSGADIAVSVTGIAGPGGGTREKPVGLVYYGLARRERTEAGGVSVATFRTCFPSGRDLVRLFASHRALDLIRRRLLGLPLELPGDAEKGARGATAGSVPAARRNLRPER